MRTSSAAHQLPEWGKHIYRILAVPIVGRFMFSEEEWNEYLQKMETQWLQKHHVSIMEDLENCPNFLIQSMLSRKGSSTMHAHPLSESIMKNLLNEQSPKRDVYCDRLASEYFLSSHTPFVRCLFNFVKSAIIGMLSLTSPVTTTAEPAADHDICPSYGCPLTSQDILSSTVKKALDCIQGKPKNTLPQSTQDILTKLDVSCDESKATLALTGYKGGEVKDQINQDRGIVVCPYVYDPTQKENRVQRLMGIFDGHSLDGEIVAEFCQNQMPLLLAEKLSARLKPGISDEEHDKIVKIALEETFVELHENCGPAGEQGGCTASVILQLGDKLFVANTGDSRSFICFHHSSTDVTGIAYMTEDHKPHLPEEKARVESMGAQVWVPRSGPASSRVLLTDPNTGDQTALATSRSIGDRDVTSFGVIPNPQIDIIDIQILLTTERTPKSFLPSWLSSPPAPEEKLVDDVHIFAVSATDGMIDILDAKAIARFLASSLCKENGDHLLTACEKLIYMAADGWRRATADGSYRDDIAISVSKIRSPSCK